MQVQAEYVKENWLSYYGGWGGGGFVKFVGYKKHSANGKELNVIIALELANATKLKNDSKAKAI